MNNIEDKFNLKSAILKSLEFIKNMSIQEWQEYEKILKPLDLEIIEQEKFIAEVEE